MTKTIKITTVSATALIMGLSAANADTWRYAFEESLDEVQGVFAQKFKEEVEANSDHEVQLFPFGTLGESDDILQQTQAGILQFVNQSPGFTGSVIPEAQVFFVPYLLPQDEESLFSFFRNSEAINELFPPLYAQQGLELLTMYPEGEVMISTKEPFTSPAELSEVRVRVMTNPLLVESYRAFGAVPTPLPWGEVYGALQTGMIQGQENPAFFIESTKMYEVTDYITRTGHNNFTTALMANQAFYEGLSDEDREVVDNAVEAAFEHILEYQSGLTERSLEKIMESRPSITITELDEAQRQAFMDTAPSVEAIYLDIGGAQAQEILDQMKADLDAAMSDAGAEAEDSAAETPAEAVPAAPAPEAEVEAEAEADPPAADAAPEAAPEAPADAQSDAETDAADADADADEAEDEDEAEAAPAQ